MGNINTTFFDNLDAAATWSAGVAFKRSKGLPLDKYSVFETKALAIEYAEKRGAYAETPVSYPGQVIAVAEGNKMVAYVLAENAEGTKLELQQIGIIPTGDDKTIDVTEDGVISLLAADKEVFKKDAEGKPTEEKEINVGAQLVLQADGTLKWVKPDTTTVEGLSTAVEDLKGRMTTAENDINALEEAVGAPVKGETPATGLYAELDKKADKDTTYTKTEVDTAIDNAVKGILGEDIDEAYDTLKEIQDILTGTDGETIDGVIEGIEANKQAIQTLNGDVNTIGSVDKKIADAIDAENLGQYTTGEELEEAIKDFATDTEVTNAVAAEAAIARAAEKANADAIAAI